MQRCAAISRACSTYRALPDPGGPLSNLDRFLRTYDTLRERAGWLEPQASVSATQAALLVLADAEHLAERVPQAMQELREAAGFFSNVKGPVGQALVALALVEGQSGAVVPAREKPVRRLFKESGLPWAPGLWTSSTAAWLGLLHEERVEQLVPRMALIMARWKQDHPWITGADDLHTAALHALTGELVADIGRRTEDRYQELGGMGFGLGFNARQRAAQLTALRPEISATVLVARMRVIRRAFQAQGRTTWFRSVEPLALLALADGEPDLLGAELHGTLAAIESRTGFVADTFRFLIAAGLVTGQHRPQGPQPLQGALLAVMVAAVQAQHAAAAAAAAG